MRASRPSSRTRCWARRSTSRARGPSTAVCSPSRRPTARSRPTASTSTTRSTWTAPRSTRSRTGSRASLGGKNKVEAASKIRWILENSYPQVKDLTALGKTVGVDGLTAEDAAAGTQAAIWKFSDNKNATPRNAKAKKLRDYLLGDANKGIAAEPNPSLTLNPDSVSGKSGNKLGPFTLKSSAAEVKLTVTGDAADKVKVVDKDGKPVGATLTGPIKDTQLFLDVPAGTRTARSPSPPPPTPSCPAAGSSSARATTRSGTARA